MSIKTRPVKTLIQFALLALLVYLLANISLASFEVFYYEEDRNQLISQNKNTARQTLALYPELPIDHSLSSDEQKQLLFSLMLLEKHPEGLSQLEMLYHVHDLPLLFKTGEAFSGSMDLSTLYDNYRARLQTIGESGEYSQRHDFVNPPDNFSPELLQDILVISDFQMRDEESPFLLYPLKPYFPTSYYPANPHVPYVVDDAIKTLRKFEQAQNRHIDLALFTGDMTDNGHYNEVRWGIDVLDGSVVHPDSGKDDDIFPGLFANGEPNDTADPFFAKGLEHTPWYFVPGNHDGLAMGVFQMTYAPLDLFITQLNEGTYAFMNEISVGSTNYLGNIPNIRSMLRYLWSDEPFIKVHPDEDRRLMNATEIAREMFNSFSKPKGHGMQWAVDIENNRSFSFTQPAKNTGPNIRHIALDTNTNHPFGEFNDERMAWLTDELEEALVNQELVVVSSHHTPLDIIGNGQALIELMNSYPHVIAHLVAHRHKNAIKARPGASPELSYWEIESGSMVNWPQQLRLLQVKVDQHTGVGMLESTMLNHHNPNPYAVSERGRFLAYLEAYFHGGEDKLANREGDALARNTQLYFSLPDFLSQ